MEYYHVLNRGVEKRSIVLNDHERLRFVKCLYYMNDERSTENVERDLRAHEIDTVDDMRERLVTVHAWCLMNNHYHLLLSEEVAGGIGRYTRKLNIGYTHFFNLRHKRSGVLFQGKTKKISITTDRHFLYILPYIHLNPLGFQKSTEHWRTQCQARPESAIAYCTSYRWSSLKNYSGGTEFSTILAGSDPYTERTEHIHEIKHFLSSAQGSTLAPITLE